MQRRLDLNQLCAEAAARRPELAPVVQTVLAIADAAANLSTLIAQGVLADPSSAGDINADGDVQKPLDVAAHLLMVAALRDAPVSCVISEESADVEWLDPGAPLAVAIDPIDGSSNIEINAGIGTIFSIRAAAEPSDAFAAFSLPGSSQLAAGFTLYGPQTVLALSLGDGVDIFTLDRARNVFVQTHAALKLPDDTAEYAINASNYRHWEQPVRVFIDDCIAGATGPRGKDFNTRWNASVVAEAFRILQRGGIFLYPADGRRGYEKGRLRLLYEAAPLAFLIEQAGGRATTGRQRILDLKATSPHQRVPLIFGCAPSVARLEDLHTGRPLGADNAPLFSARGLLRS